jgi:hypothetical protein
MGERRLMPKFHAMLREENTISSANSKAPVDSKTGDTELDDSNDVVEKDGTYRISDLPVSRKINIHHPEAWTRGRLMT